MRAAFRLLLTACLLWCALGIAEPVQAHGGNAAPHAAAPADGESHGAAPDGVGGAHHHHCPIAPDLPIAPATDRTIVVAARPVAPAAATLDSLHRAPPLPPPSAA